MSGVIQNIAPPPPRLWCWGRTHLLGGKGVGGGSIFWKTLDTALYSTYVSTLCAQCYSISAVLLYSNSHWSAFLISRNHSITQLISFPKKVKKWKNDCVQRLILSWIGAHERQLMNPITIHYIILLWIQYFLKNVSQVHCRRKIPLFPGS